MSTVDPGVQLFDALLGFRDALKGEVNGPPVWFLKYCIENFEISHAQLFQDLFVLFCLRGKRKGFFVEFGATNGVGLSNSYLLEKKFNWRGILAEPGRRWHADLKKNRSASIDQRCVWRATGEKLEFKETPYGELSTILEFVDTDMNNVGRQTGDIYEVETVSLNDLLAFHNSPRQIDYLSIDTEGSEYEILKEFDFQNYTASIITVEHNYTSAREKLNSLLEANQYINVFPVLSKFDDWYLHRTLFEQLLAR